MPEPVGPELTTDGVSITGRTIRLGTDVWPRSFGKDGMASSGRCLGLDPETGEFLFGVTVPDVEPTYTLRGTPLTQHLCIFADPFGRHTTKISRERAERPQPNTTFGQFVTSQRDQLELLRIGRQLVADLEAQCRASIPPIDKRLEGKQRREANQRREAEVLRCLWKRYGEETEEDKSKDDGLQVRVLLASLTGFRQMLTALTKDPALEVRQAAFSNPYAANFGLYGGPSEKAFLSTPHTWGPQVVATELTRAQSVGVTINPYGFDPARHHIAVSRRPLQELRELSGSFFGDSLRWAQHYIRRLIRGEGEPTWVDYDKGVVVPPVIDWGNLRPESIDGIMVGMNFGMGRLMEVDGSTNAIKTSAWASQIQAHMQFSVLLRGVPYPQYEQIYETCLEWPTFMVQLAEAYENSPLRIWSDENVVMYAARAPRGAGEMGILCRNCGSLLDEDAPVDSIAAALSIAAGILQRNDQYTFNVLSFGKRISDDDSAGVRLMFEIIPRGGLAFSELGDQWVVDLFPEDYVDRCRKGMGGQVLHGFEPRPS